MAELKTKPFLRIHAFPRFPTMADVKYVEQFVPDDEWDEYVALARHAVYGMSKGAHRVLVLLFQKYVDLEVS